jgi:nucleoside 2-deoxyribosyltransferase
MNIYFSCSLTGGRKDEHIYAHIVDHLLDRGFEVPTEHLARPEVMELEQIVDPEEVFQRDIDWIDACDAVIAEVSTPSHGVGYEIAYALSVGKPVLCCYHEGNPVSKMITGNRTPGLSVQSYTTEQEAIDLIESFLAR